MRMTTAVALVAGMLALSMLTTADVAAQRGGGAQGQGTWVKQVQEGAATNLQEEKQKAASSGAR